jgi:hypothetical protein
MVKLQKVWDLMEKLGLRVDRVPYETLVTDKEFPDRVYEMVDVSDGGPIHDFPPVFEYKLCYNDHSEDYTQEVLES